jgi:hypothetical protein
MGFFANDCRYGRFLLVERRPVLSRDVRLDPGERSLIEFLRPQGSAALLCALIILVGLAAMNGLRHPAFRATL